MARIAPGHQGEEVVVDDIARQREWQRRSPHPSTAGLVDLQVVVGQGLDVVGAGVGALEGGDAYRHGVPLGSTTVVHSSVLEANLLADGRSAGIAAYTENRRGDCSAAEERRRTTRERGGPGFNDAAGVGGAADSGRWSGQVIGPPSASSSL